MNFALARVSTYRCFSNNASANCNKFRCTECPQVRWVWTVRFNVMNLSRSLSDRKHTCKRLFHLITASSAWRLHCPRSNSWEIYCGKCFSKQHKKHPFRRKVLNKVFEYKMPFYIWIITDSCGTVKTRFFVFLEILLTLLLLQSPE